MKIWMLNWVLLTVVSSCWANEPLKTRNVVVVTIDGLRWQEVFRGADDALANREFGGVFGNELIHMQQEFGRPTMKERREILMPFFWSEIARNGQLYGNRDLGSRLHVTNAVKLSYPGYQEMLGGFADNANITGNVPLPNPNVTVLEWLNNRPELRGKVVPLAAWNGFASVFNVKRSGLPLWLTNQTSDPSTASPRLLEIEQWMRDIPTKNRDEHYDGFVYRAALEALERQRPRLLFVGFDEPDANGHLRVYDRYLDSIRRSDRFIRELWEKLQSMPDYRGVTTLIITTDHGRGETGKGWARHDVRTAGSDQGWLAILGPDTPALGERGADAPEIRLSQVAATIARFLGEDFNTGVPRADHPVAEAFNSGKD